MRLIVFFQSIGTVTKTIEKCLKWIHHLEFDRVTLLFERFHIRFVEIFCKYIVRILLSEIFHPLFDDVPWNF